MDELPGFPRNGAPDQWRGALLPWRPMTDRPPTLSAAALALLPDRGTAPRCAPHAREIEVDPVGSALAVDVIVTVELALPWPKPVFTHPVLDGLRPTLSTAAGEARILATVPQAGAGRTIRVWQRTPDGARAVVVDRGDTTPADALASLLTEGLDAFAGVHGVEPTSAEPAILICTQGSHDVCCGSEGARLADAATSVWPATAVHRVSHTGGHRFAPTALTLPDGRMWAFLDATDLPALAAGDPDPDHLATRCRGWWGAAGGAAQAAERAVWQRTGSNDPRRTVAGRGGGEFTVTDPSGPGWIVRVEPGREIPTIACRADGGLPAKPGREWRVVDVSPAV